MSFKSYYNELPKKYEENKHKNLNKLMPIYPHRTCIVGASNTGKTHILMNIINESNKVHKIYLHAKNLDEPLYQCFIDYWTERGKSIGFDILEYSNDINDVVHLTLVEHGIQNLIVFDNTVYERNLDKVSDCLFVGVKIIVL